MGNPICMILIDLITLLNTQDLLSDRIMWYDPSDLLETRIRKIIPHEPIQVQTPHIWQGNWIGQDQVNQMNHEYAINEGKNIK